MVNCGGAVDGCAGEIDSLLLLAPTSTKAKLETKAKLDPLWDPTAWRAVRPGTLAHTKRQERSGRSPDAKAIRKPDPI